MYLFGANGHGKVVAEIAELNNLQIDAFIDDNVDLKYILNYPVLHEVPLIKNNSNVIISIGNNVNRRKIVEEYKNFNFPILIHPKTSISKRSIINEGTVIMAGVSINLEVIIGKHCIINTNASIDHECIIEDFVHISPNVALAGNVFVGEGTHIGIGVSVIPGITIGKWCTIGAGAVIIKDIPDGSKVVGNPGKSI